MHRYLLASVAALVFGMGAASAADLVPPPPTPVYNKAPVAGPAGWDGFYIGVNAGYGWSPHNDQLQDFNSNAFTGLSPKGAFGGGQIGYNAQLSRIVLGVEADFQGSGIGDKQTFNGVLYQSDLDWFGTVRGRIGYSMGPALAYFTGGLAYGGMDNKVDYAPPTYRFQGTATGYVLGGGIEYKISPAWSLKGEYQFISLGTNDPLRTTDGRGFSTFVGTKVDKDEFQTVRIGLNYQFGK